MSIFTLEVYIESALAKWYQTPVIITIFYKQWLMEILWPKHIKS